MSKPNVKCQMSRGGSKSYGEDDGAVNPGGEGTHRLDAGAHPIASRGEFYTRPLKISVPTLMPDIDEAKRLPLRGGNKSRHNDEIDGAVAEAKRLPLRGGNKSRPYGFGLTILMKRLSPSILLAGIIIAVGLLMGIVSGHSDGRLHLNFYDVWQGDSLLIKSPQGASVLVDGGPNEMVLTWLGEDLAFYQHQIDLVVLTHPQADHLTGLVEVLKRYRVKEILMPKVVHSSEVYLSFLDLIYTKNIKVHQAQSGQKLALDQGRVLIEVLWPPKDFIVGSDLNEASVVLLLQYGHFQALLTGDAEAEIQWQLMSGVDLGPVTVLKVPHHGAGKALDESFLRLIKPKLAIISVGAKNRFGHPRPETLVLLEAIGSKVLRTDIDGTVRVAVDSQGKWQVRTEN